MSLLFILFPSTVEIACAFLFAVLLYVCVCVCVCVRVCTAQLLFALLCTECVDKVWTLCQDCHWEKE